MYTSSRSDLVFSESPSLDAAHPAAPCAWVNCHFWLTEHHQRAHGGRRGVYHAPQDATCHGGDPILKRTRRPRLWPWMRLVLFLALVYHLQNKGVVWADITSSFIRWNVTFSSYSDSCLSHLIGDKSSIKGYYGTGNSAWLSITHVFSLVPTGCRHLAGFNVTDSLCQG